MFLQSFCSHIQSDPRGESVDRGNMKLAYDSVSGSCDLHEWSCDVM